MSLKSDLERFLGHPTEYGTFDDGSIDLLVLKNCTHVDKIVLFHRMKWYILCTYAHPSSIHT